MNKSSVPFSRYLSLLGYSSKDELIEHVVRHVLTAIEERRGTKPPIAVSSVADRFMICPTPLFDNSTPEGTIEFDANQGQFLIRMNGRRRLPTEKSSKALYVDDDLPPDLCLTYRGRFTYAHEVAHRFFFVMTERGWQRAAEVAVRDTGPGSRPKALTQLRRDEEQLCNEIAGNILVPKPDLVRIFGRDLAFEEQGALSNFAASLRRAARLFRVSYECILVRLERAIELQLIPCSKNLCVLLVRMSDRKYGARRSRWELRVRECILPRILHGTELKQPFTGLALRHLGNEAHIIADSMLRERAQERQVELPLALQADKQGTAVTNSIPTRLKGWSTVLSAGNEDSGVLIWGTLDAG